MQRTFTIAVSICLLVLAGCASDQTQPVSVLQANVDHKHIQEIAQKLPDMKFDHQHTGPNAACPNLGSNCALTPRPKPPVLTLLQLDSAIANGPSGIASFFTDVSKPWQFITPGIDSVYPAIYGDLCQSKYWAIRQDENSGTDIEQRTCITGNVTKWCTPVQRLCWATFGTFTAEQRMGKRSTHTQFRKR